MLAPLIFALVYAALDTNILFRLNVSINDAQNALSLTIRVLGMAVRFDSVLVREKNGLTLHMQPRYAPKTEKHFSLSQEGEKRRFARIRPFIRPVLSRLNWGIVDLHARIGLEDAAATAMAAGAIRSIATGMLACFGLQIPCEIRVEPDFQRAGVVAAAHCIFSAKTGDIIIAVAKTRMSMLGVKRWKRVPTRA